MPIAMFREFFKLEAAGGIILVIASVTAIIIANSPFNQYYTDLMHIDIIVKIHNFQLNKDLLHWINDGLMAVFFLLVGLEIKREVLEGQLSSRQQFSLPAIAALGGLILPAIIYSYINWGNDSTINGWAIPTATDIAFALGLVTLLGKRVPVSLKITLVAIAIIDDLAAIVIIALFYTDHLVPGYLILGLLCLVALAIFNKKGFQTRGPYLAIGFIMWAFILKSGVHATLAGVALAFFIPLKTENASEESPLHKLEHSLHPWVAFSILPIFAFANAGVSLNGVSITIIKEPVFLGIAIGLFFGKQIGVLSFTYIGTILNICALPKGINWKQYYGLTLITGIGFTMSLFIGNLAFTNDNYDIAVRLGVITGSVLAGTFGYFVLRFTTKRHS
jgi:NhaA family Na+:H+ antiporter